MKSSKIWIKLFLTTWNSKFCCIYLLFNMGPCLKNATLNILLLSYNDRIQKDLVDPEKLQATLGDESLAKGSDLKKALEMVALLEAQMKEMNPNLDSITE